MLSGILRRNSKGPEPRSSHEFATLAVAIVRWSRGCNCKNAKSSSDTDLSIIFSLGAAMCVMLMMMVLMMMMQARRGV